MPPTQYSILNTQYSILNTQYSILNTQYSILNTQYALLRQSIIPFSWTLVIGVLTGLPGKNFPDMSFWKLLQFDSAAHAFVFLVFTFLWGVALAKQRNFGFLSRNAVGFAAIVGVLYGISIEIMQYYIFIGRSCEFSDMVSDATGCLIGYFVFKAVYGKVLRLQFE